MRRSNHKMEQKWFRSPTYEEAEQVFLCIENANIFIDIWSLQSMCTFSINDAKPIEELILQWQIKTPCLVKCFKASWQSKHG